MMIKYLKPRMWFIENPRNGLLKSRRFMQGFGFVDLDYCQFASWGYKNQPGSGEGPHPKVRPVLCPGRSCQNALHKGNGHWGHIERLGGNHMRTSTAGKGRIPAALINHLCDWERDPEMVISAIHNLRKLRLSVPRPARTTGKQ